MSVLQTFLESYGLPAIVVGTFLEGETILLLAGLAAHRGYLPLPAVIAAGFLGTFAGDQLYFHLGRRHGERFLAKRPKWHSGVARAREVLERHDVAFILGFRFLYGLRTVSPFAIGMSGIGLRRFVILNGLGGLAWTAAITLLGYGVGQGAETLIGRVKTFEAWLFLWVALAGGTAWLIRHLRGRSSSVG